MFSGVIHIDEWLSSLYHEIIGAIDTNHGTFEGWIFYQLEIFALWR